MEGYSRKDEGSPQLLDLIPKDREWASRRSDKASHGVSEEKKLELTLGPPRGEWSTTSVEREGLLPLGHCPTSPCLQNPVLAWHHPSYLHLQSGYAQVAVNKESSQPCSNRAAAENNNKAFSANTAVHSSGSAQKRSAPAAVVGWPPIRSFRKNMASSTTSKLASDAAADVDSSKVEKGSLVKINMDGIPIGRKVDLKAYNSYEKLSLGVDELFKGLVAAQKDGGGRGKGIGMGGLLDGSGEYTLVYEDNEGDRMLVGDVPWHMFVSTVKRLRVLKSSEVAALSRGSKHGHLV